MLILAIEEVLSQVERAHGYRPTVRQLSRMSGVPVTPMARLMRGEGTLSLASARKLAEALGMTASELLAIGERRVAERAQKKRKKLRTPT